MPGTFRSRACAKTPQTGRDLRTKGNPCEISKKAGQAHAFVTVYEHNKGKQ